MTATQLLLVPYDSGQRGVRMGAGPEHLLRHGAASRLRGSGDVGAAYVESASAFATEVGTTFELHARLAEAVRGAAALGARPVVLSGNCGFALGTLAGLALAGRHRTGVIWLDAHGEFNTPETTASGYLDGMGLAVITGGAWRTLASRVPGFAPLPPERLLLLGTRELDAPEEEAIPRQGVTMLPAAALQEVSSAAPSALAAALDTLALHADAVYVHVDPDVLDPALARGNTLAPPGGLSPGELLSILREVRQRMPIAAVGVASYDPAADDNAEVLRTLLDALGVLAG